MSIENTIQDDFQIPGLTFYSGNEDEPDVIVNTRIWNGHGFVFIKSTNIGLDDQTVIAMAGTVANFSYSLFFDLENNEITDEGAKALADVFKDKKVSVLSLSGNKVTEEGIKALEVAAKTNDAFTYIVEEKAIGTARMKTLFDQWANRSSAIDNNGQSATGSEENIGDLVTIWL